MNDERESLFPPVGSVWETRYRVLGASAVWDDVMICEILTGPDAGEKIALFKTVFGGPPSGRPGASKGEGRGIFDGAKLSAARRRATEALS